jgi:hypothetical protein
LGKIFISAEKLKALCKWKRDEVEHDAGIFCMRFLLTKAKQEAAGDFNILLCICIAYVPKVVPALCYL